MVQPEGNWLNQASYPVAPGLMWSVPLVGRLANTLLPRVGAVVLYEYIEVSEVQLKNALPPIEATPSEMLIEVSDLQPKNINPPIEVNVDGKLIEVSEEQP